jgi:hypothetical protein
MPFYKFQQNDIFYNRVKTHPEASFFMWSGSIYYNNIFQSGSNTNTPNGHINLYEINVNRSTHLPGDAYEHMVPTASALAYQFLTKESGLTSFKTVSTKQFNKDFVYGDLITSSLPMTASISFDYHQPGIPQNNERKPRVRALQNVFNFYKKLSPHYAYESGLGSKESGSMMLVSVPSIFYGTSIKKGSVRLKYYITGTVTAELHDLYKNGELIQVSGTGYANSQAPFGTSSVAGVVLYDHGFVALTGAWGISPNKQNYRDVAGNVIETAKWMFFGSTGSAQGTTPLAPSASYELSFQGTTYTPTVTLMAHARKGELNHSNNSTYKLKGSGESNPFISASNFFLQDLTSSIKNTVKSDFKFHSASFKKQTFISKVGIYDKDKNLIAIAKLATPVKKTEKREFTFKMKLDI